MQQLRTYYKQQVADFLAKKYMSGETVRRIVDEHNIQVSRRETGPQSRLFSVANLYEVYSHHHANRKGSKKRPETQDLLSAKRRPVVMTVYAPKGGVGKTTMAHNLSAIFPLFGYRTLVIDFDFQSNLTLAFGYDSDLTLEEAESAGIPRDQVVEYHFGHLMPNWPKGEVALNDVIKKPYGEFGPHLVPADLMLDQLDSFLTVQLMNGEPADLQIAQLLSDGIEGRNARLDIGKYDVIIFDAAPAKNPKTRGALLASDLVITPVSMEKFSTKGLSYLATVLDDMQERYGRSPKPVVCGNFFDSKRTRVISQLQLIESTYSGAWLGPTVRRSEEFQKALNVGLPLALAAPGKEASQELITVARAVLQRAGLDAREVVDGQ